MVRECCGADRKEQEEISGKISCFLARYGSACL